MSRAHIRSYSYQLEELQERMNVLRSLEGPCTWDSCWGIDLVVAAPVTESRISNAIFHALSLRAVQHQFLGTQRPRKTQRPSSLPVNLCFRDAEELRSSSRPLTYLSRCKFEPIRRGALYSGEAGFLCPHRCGVWGWVFFRSLRE